MKLSFGNACLLLVALTGSLLLTNSTSAQQSEPQELPRPQAAAAPQSAPTADVQDIPEISRSLQAGLEAYRAAQQQRLGAISRQLALNNEMRWRSALPPWQAYYSPSAAVQSAERAYGNVADPPAWAFWSDPGSGTRFSAPPVSLADSIMQAPWSPWSNVDIFGYRYDNPVRQPVGQASAQTGPNTWESRPVYRDEVSPVAGARNNSHTGIDENAELAARSEIKAGKDAAAARHRAFEALENGEFTTALEEASLMLRFDPANSEAMFLSMHADLGLVQFADAVLDLEQALAHAAPQDWNMIVRDYKVYYRTSGAFTRQLRKAESAVAATPTDVDARLILGYLYAGLGYADEAVSQLQEVKRHAEPDSTAAQLVERLLQEVERGEAGGGEAGGGRAWDEHARDGGELPPPPAKDDGADTSDAKSRRKRIF